MIPTGLSFQQAPPISGPFRFFLTAPWFLLCAAVMLIVVGPDLMRSRHAPAALAATHLLTLGFTSMVMVGALLQLLPVLAGLVVPRPVLTARLIHWPLTLGSISLATSFLWSESWLRVFCAGSLCMGFGVLLVSFWLSLRPASAPNVFLGTLRLALVALALTVGMGLTLLMMRDHGLPISYARWADLHPQWGIVAWSTFLVMGVAYALIPLFLLTPAYPKRIVRFLVPGLMTILVLKTLLSGGSNPGVDRLESACNATLALGCILFSWMTLRLLGRRKRKVMDVTIYFWNIGLVALLLAGVIGLLLPWAAQDRAENLRLTMGVLLLPGFLIAVIHGMLYKIIPFLTWFHLQSAYPRSGIIPNVRELQAPYRAKPQAAFYAISLLFLVLACWFPSLSRGAGVLWAMDAWWLGSNLLGSAMTYKRVQKIARSRPTA